ncbi:MAG: 30S ribosomal protein S4e [Candidatus Altiarchaeota archaeon]|nr:30S ribosomal protein S4e [Candidatus Altiarchaeota archaeon]
MHTKRIAVGYGKGKRWVSVPNPGPHEKSRSIPLLLVIRDMLGYADNSREAKKIINEGMVQVDKKARRDPKYGVGLMDVVEFPKIKKYFRVMPGKKGLTLKEINETESKIKLCRITGKSRVKKGLIQIALHDGGTIITDKSDYRVNDTLVLELPERKIKDSISFGKGCVALVYKGRHSGESGKITELILGTATRKSVTSLENLQTLTNYSFIVGSDKPLIKI